MSGEGFSREQFAEVRENAEVCLRHNGQWIVGEHGMGKIVLAALRLAASPTIYVGEDHEAVTIVDRADVRLAASPEREPDPRVIQLVDEAFERRDRAFRGLTALNAAAFMHGWVKGLAAKVRALPSPPPKGGG